MVMNTNTLQSRKYQLIEKVMKSDEQQLSRMEAALSEEAELAASLDRALDQVKNGEVTPHREVRKKYKKWL